MSALEAALASGDVEAFDRAVDAIGGARPLLRALLDRATDEELASVQPLLPREPRAGVRALDGATLDVRALAPRGPVALWLATDWILRVVPGLDRRAPLPVHEQWDALVEIHRARPECAWLVIELLASLPSEQRALGQRIAIGIARRFGERARRIAQARLARATHEERDVALRDLLASV